MKKNSLVVVLNMSTLSVPEKIRKATAVVDGITANPTVFASPSPAMADVTAAINALDAAYLATADGGKSKTAVMHDNVNVLMKIMHQVVAYVELVAADDNAIVHLAGLDVKKHGVRSQADFSVTPAEHGQVFMQVKARKNTVYKWQYKLTKADAGIWVDALFTHVSKASVAGLEAGLYLFRVIFIDGSGEHEGDTISLAVN